MRIEVTVDTSEVKKALEALGRRESKAAINRALTRATRSTTSEASRLVREDLNVKAQAVRGKDGRTIQTTRPRNEQASVVVKGQGIPLSFFKGTRQVRKGLSIQVMRGGARKLLQRGRFLHPTKGTAIQRSRDNGKPVPRVPTDVLFGPAVAQFVGRKDRLERLRNHASSRFLIELEREIVFRLKRLTGGL